VGGRQIYALWALEWGDFFDFVNRKGTKEDPPGTFMAAKARTYWVKSFWERVVKSCA